MEIHDAICINRCTVGERSMFQEVSQVATILRRQTENLLLTNTTVNNYFN